MAIIFQTRFENSLETDFPDGDTPSYGPTFNRILGRGIDYGYAFTCTNGAVVKKLAPYLGSNYTTLTTRVQWGIQGNLFESGNIPGMPILGWMDPINANSASVESFVSYLTALPNGVIHLYITKGVGGDVGRLNAKSADNVLNYDGRMHAIQVTFSFSGHTTVTYNVVVNNVSVLSGTFVAGAASSGGTTTWKSGGIERAFITVVHVAASRLPAGGTYHYMSSTAEVQVEDSINIISYLPCNAINADENIGCVPFIPPPPDISGIYFVKPGTRHDKYNNDVEKKIPDPTIRVPYIGE